MTKWHEKDLGDGVESLLNIWTKFDRLGTVSKVQKKHFDCVARGGSGKDCVAMEQVEMLFGKAKYFKEY